MPTDIDVLTAERHHLSASRDALASMREQTSDWQQVSAGDHVSTQYLRQVLYRRMQALQDNPEVPLFFGRVDHAERLGAEFDEVCHIGRRHVSGEVGGDPLVIDWRAPLSLPFYRARPGDPMHCSLRRRFGFQRGELTAFEDEDLTGDLQQTSTILEAEIERPRTGPMRDIVATIQPDQDVLVRTDLGTSMAIQGAPGTGKTAVGLHRAAYLLYAFRQQLSRSGVLVVGPNDSFLRYIGDVLPALGEIDATQHTIASLVSKAVGVEVKAVDVSAREVLKGDARMAEVCRRAVWSHVSRPTETLVVPKGVRQWRVPPPLLGEAVDALLARGVRYLAGRAMLPQRFAHQVLLRMEVAGETTDDRVQNAVARTAPIKKLVEQVWPALTPAKLVHRLLSDADFLAAHADGLLDEHEQALLIGTKPPPRPRAMTWTLADLVLLDEVSDLLNRTGSVGHVVVDEAQDLSAMQLRAVGRRATTGSVTLLGDLAQATTAWAVRDWDAALELLGHPEAAVTELVEGFRVPGDVIDYAARLLPSIAPGLAPPRSIRHSRGELVIEDVFDVVLVLGDRCRRLLEREGTLGLIHPDAMTGDVAAAVESAGLLFHTVGDVVDVDEPLTETERHRLELVPASLAKGLEFDHVLLVEPAAIVAGEPDAATGLRRLYVCLTRAVSSLVVLHHEELPKELV